VFFLATPSIPFGVADDVPIDEFDTPFCYGNTGSISVPGTIAEKGRGLESRLPITY